MSNDKKPPAAGRPQAGRRADRDASEPGFVSQAPDDGLAIAGAPLAHEIERRHARAAELVADALIAMLVSEGRRAAEPAELADPHAQGASDRKALDETARRMAVSTSRDESARRRGKR